jgi:hypothetical protein
MINKKAIDKHDPKKETTSFDLNPVAEYSMGNQESKHCRIRSTNCTSPTLQILNKKKQKGRYRMMEKQERKSISSIKELNNELVNKSIVKITKRNWDSLSNPRSKLDKSSRYSCDATNSKFNLIMSSDTLKVMPIAIKEIKSAMNISCKRKSAASKLSKHIESTLGFRATLDKGLSLQKKLPNKHPNLPLPNIFKTSTKL